MHLPTLTFGILSLAAVSAYAQPGWVISQASQGVPGRPSAAPALETTSSPTVQADSAPASAPSGSGSSSKPKHSGSSGSSSAGAGKSSVGKNPPPMIASPEPFHLTLSAGWNSKYEFKHFDQIFIATALDDSSDSIWQLKAEAQYDNFGFGVTFIQSLEEHKTRFAPNDGKDFYQEIILGTNYTTQLAPNLDASVGYNLSLFPNEGFLNGSVQGEAQIRLRYTGIEHFQPSVAYSNIHGDVAFLGDWIEARVDSPWVLHHNGDFEVGINLSAEVAYDMKLNSNSNGFAGFVVRAALPVKVSRNVVITLSGNYGWDIENNNHSALESQLDFWGGATVSYRF
jgi:hypothetical protein